MAYKESVAFFLEQPSEFIDAAGIKSATPGKSRESFLDAFAQQDTEAENLSCCLVQSLTHSEMQFIDEYADKLTRVGVSEEDAVNMSVQSFAKGIDSAHKRMSLGPIAPETEEEKCAPQTASKFHPTHLRWDDAGSEIVINEVLASQIEETGTLETSLRKLFEDDNESAEQHESEDAKLVMIYAAEVCLYGGIDPEVAHGVALDMFLDGPVEFRARMSTSAPKDDEAIEDAEDVAEPIVEPVVESEPSVVDEDDEDLVDVEDESPLEGAMEVDNVDEEANLDELRNLLHDNVSKSRHTTATPRRAGRLLNTPATQAVTTAKPSASARRAQRSAQDEEEGNDFASHLLGQQALALDIPVGASVTLSKVAFAEHPVIVSSPEEIAQRMPSEVVPVEVVEVSVEELPVSEPVVVEETVTEVTKSETKGKGKGKGKGKKDVDSKAAPKPVVEEVVVEDLIEIIVLFCDKCDKEVPLDETGLDAVPEGDWFCKKCAPKQAAKKPARAPAAKAKKEVVQEEVEEEIVVLLCDR